MKASTNSCRLVRAAFLSCILVALSSCSRPPDDVLKQGITASAQMEMVRKNPFASTGEVTLKDYKVTNTYKRDNVHVYEYEATVIVKGGFGNPKPGGQENTVKGKVGFQKAGNRWDSSPLL